MREFAQCPYPGIGQRVIPRAPCSEPRPVAPRTFAEILRWWELREGARGLLNSLDNTRRIYDEPYCPVKDGGSFEAVADQADVFGIMMNLMYRVNDMLKQLGKSIRWVGGGGGRSMSYTDFIVRLTSSQSSLTDMSRQVLATILVKGDWDFDLKRGESLEDALNDPQRSEAITAAVQEVGADEDGRNLPIVCMICYLDKLLPARESSSVHITESPSNARFSVWIHGLRE